MIRPEKGQIPPLGRIFSGEPLFDKSDTHIRRLIQKLIPYNFKSH